jgi:hypothetical protein
MISAPRAVSVPSKVPAISASSTWTSPLKTPAWEMESSGRLDHLALDRALDHQALGIGNRALQRMPRPTTSVRRSAGAGRAGGVAIIGAGAAGAAGPLAMPGMPIGAPVGRGGMAVPAGGVGPEGSGEVMVGDLGARLMDWSLSRV